MDTMVPGPDLKPPEQPETGSASKIKRWVGLLLVALSFGFYGGLLLVPMIPFSDKGKVLISALLVISGEASFWIGAFVLGKEAMSRFRSRNIRDWLHGLLNRKP